MGFAHCQPEMENGIRETAWKGGGGLALGDRQTNPQTLSEPLIDQLLHDVCGRIAEDLLRKLLSAAGERSRGRRV